jgi:hypothetical protein
MRLKLRILFAEEEPVNCFKFDKKDSKNQKKKKKRFYIERKVQSS